MTRKKVVGKRRHGLTPEILKALLNRAIIGPDRVFTSEKDRHQAWIEFKDEIMSTYAQPGERPDAWWKFEAPECPWFGESNRQALARLNLLTDAEIAYLKELGQWPVKPCPGPDWDPREILNS
jgi:hypothetical protein